MSPTLHVCDQAFAEPRSLINTSAMMMSRSAEQSESLFAIRNCELIEQAQAPFDALSLPMSWIRKQSVLDAEQTFLRESRSKT
jgi:hypothetical protein